MNAHSFTVGADYRSYAATVTGLKGGSADTWRDIIASEGKTALEANDDGGAIRSAPNIAGTVPPMIGAWYVRVRQVHIRALPDTIHSYDFYVRVLSGSPIPEREPSDEDAPEVPRSNGWRGRVIGPATAKPGGFAITVNGRDTIGVIVAVDLERGAPVWNVIAGTGEFTGSFIITL